MVKYGKVYLVMNVLWTFSKGLNVYICEKSKNEILGYVLLNYLLYVNCFFLLLIKCYNLVLSGDECSRGTLSGFKPIHHSSQIPFEHLSGLKISSDQSHCTLSEL